MKPGQIFFSLSLLISFFLFGNTNGFAQSNNTVSGTVNDGQSGETLPGVNILVKGTSTGTSTGRDGTFKLTIESLQDTLILSFIGYQTREVPIQGRTEISIDMQSQTITGEEMVVVGYGTQEKKSLTGSVSSVGGGNLSDTPVSSVDQQLEGRAPGIQVTKVSGEPGASSSIRIRGGNSIQGNNNPLIVVDDIIVGKDFNFNNLNSNNIKSIDVLKDATAVSIYGNRGANGVVLVTTKNGAGLNPGETQISISSYSGTQNMIETADFLNGPQHAAYANEDAGFRKSAKPFSDPENVPNVDWLDEVTNTAPISNIDLSISGNSDDRKINYFVSGNYFNQKGIVKNSGIKKYIFRANLDYMLSDIVKTGFNLNISRIEQNNNKVNIANIYRFIPPNRAVYDEQGNYTAENPVSATVRSNPVADLNLREDNTSETELLGKVYLQIEPLNNLQIMSRLSPTISQNKHNVFNPAGLPENLASKLGGDASINNESKTGFINENTINFKGDFGVHSVDLLGGFTVQKQIAETNTSAAYEITNEVTGFNNLGFGSNPNRNLAQSGYNSFQLVSFLGRAIYTYNDKYTITVVGREDGSSRFAQGNKYGFFPAGSVGWRLSEEPFIKNLGVFDNLKARASYGVSGSQAIDSYRTLSILNNNNTTFNGKSKAGVALGRPANPNLTWETTSSINIGLDMGFLGGRISANIDYYSKKTTDLLLNVQIPRQTGFLSRLQNIGELKNRGLELSISSTNITNANFNWSSTLSISGNRNEILDLGGQGIY